MRRPPWPLLLQIVVSGALLALLARRVPVGDTLAAMNRLQPGTFAAALALVLVSYLGRARRWAALLARAGVGVRGGTAYCLTLAGVGYGLVTPGKVGEFVRVLHLDAPRSRTLASAVWDRVTDVLLLEALSLPAFVLVPAWRGPVLWVYAAVVAATLGLLVVLESGRIQALARRFFPFAAGPLERWREASAGTLASRVFAAGLGGGVFYYAFNFAAAFLLLRDLVPGAPARLLLSFPIIPLLGNLPIAFSGLGLREQVSAALFHSIGADAAAGPAFSLLLFTVATLVPGLLGLALATTPWARSGVAGGRRLPDR
ncbi:MAG TPA: lysylphosphatidylglycerol synthase transmembrane domain-containing protein [Methylomirabilota bacterium]